MYNTLRTDSWNSNLRENFRFVEGVGDNYSPMVSGCNTGINDTNCVNIQPSDIASLTPTVCPLNPSTKKYTCPPGAKNQRGILYTDIQRCVCNNNGVCSNNICACNKDRSYIAGSPCIPAPTSDTYQCVQTPASCKTGGYPLAKCEKRVCNVADPTCFSSEASCKSKCRATGGTCNIGNSMNSCNQPGTVPCCASCREHTDGTGMTFSNCSQCPGVPAPSSSCFTGDSLVTMYDGTKKCISDVKVGELVLSATGEPSKVMIVDVEEVGNRLLVGFNDQKPFVTDDHCFVNKNSNTRLTFNPVTSKLSKHWKSIDKIVDGTELTLFNDDSMMVRNIEKISVDFDAKVYDLITSDHTYIVNDIKVYDDFPPIEDYLLETFVILELSKIADKLDLSHLKDKWDCKKIVPEFFEKYFEQATNVINGEIKGRTNEELIKSVPEKMYNYAELVNNNKNMLYIGSDIWRHYIPRINKVMTN